MKIANVYIEHHSYSNSALYTIHPTSGETLSPQNEINQRCVFCCKIGTWRYNLCTYGHLNICIPVFYMNALYLLSNVSRSRVCVPAVNNFLIRFLKYLSRTIAWLVPVHTNMSVKYVSTCIWTKVYISNVFEAQHEWPLHVHFLLVENIVCICTHI